MKQNVYDIVTDKVVDALENGTVPWHKPWDSRGIMPTSLASGKAYRGINPFLLSLQGYGSPYWLTYKQATERGGQVRKGEKSSLVVFWKKLDRKREKQEDGTEILTGAPMVLRYYNVFNTEQCDGLAVPNHDTERHDWDAIAAAEELAQGYVGAGGGPGHGGGPTLSHGGDRACYSPLYDSIYLPERDAFANGHDYYSTLFHEMTHSTGHKSRLDREGIAEMTPFGSPTYSREELVAEMGAAMLSAVAGIDQLTVPQSAAYVSSWLKVLKGDHKMVVRAAAQAQKAADLIRGISWGGES